MELSHLISSLSVNIFERMHDLKNLEISFGMNFRVIALLRKIIRKVRNVKICAFEASQ